MLPERITQPPIYREVGIIYKDSEGWPQGLTPKSEEPFKVGAHMLPGYSAYVVEVTARRLKLLDPTQDIDALRIQLADIQAIIQLCMTAKPKSKVALLPTCLKAYKLWGDITAIADRAAWDPGHIRMAIQTMTSALQKTEGPKTLEEMVAGSWKLAK